MTPYVVSSRKLRRPFREGTLNRALSRMRKHLKRSARTSSCVANISSIYEIKSNGMKFRIFFFFFLKDKNEMNFYTSHI